MRQSLVSCKRDKFQVSVFPVILENVCPWKIVSLYFWKQHITDIKWRAYSEELEYT